VSDLFFDVSSGYLRLQQPQHSLQQQDSCLQQQHTGAVAGLDILGSVVSLFRITP